ncbi:MAG: tyrosine--tRNA ligase [Bacteroidota bacterium]|nr:tyrosine--tRNA ligase [Bacteroidota bacterium]
MTTRTFPPLHEQMDVIRRGAAEILPEEDLVRKLEHSLQTGIPLRVKLGCDPSKPDLHLGHSVVLRKLRQFQDLGHQAILIVGDFTGMIGDPSGRNKTRPPLTLEETRENGRTYFEQASRILDPKHVVIQYNSDWLANMRFEDVIALAAKVTVAQMLERDDFEKRYRNREPISLHELLYPLAQAMDSVAVRSDIELGGTDQKFNLLIGREIQREYGQSPQVILTMPLIAGTDGTEKMSKALGNYIALDENPNDFYGKVLSIPDHLIVPWFSILTDAPPEHVERIHKDILAGKNPRDAKRELARTLVAAYHSTEAARAAEEHFDRLFREKLPPEEIETYIHSPESGEYLLDILLKTGLISSKNEGRSLIKQSAVSIDGERVHDPLMRVPDTPECVVKVGKRRFLRIRRADTNH